MALVTQGISHPEVLPRTVLVRRSLGGLLGMDNAELSAVDPLTVNLLVARDIPQLSDLDIPSYQRLADVWATGASDFIRDVEGEFHRDPARWKFDISFFRLGCLCEYIDCELGVRYNEEQRDEKAVLYTNPSDLFLNGVMDTRQGTCGSMATLYVVLSWRLGWPVSLACAACHLYCKYDDGRRQHNIETTNNGQGGWQSHPDEYYRKEYRIPDIAIDCGSDLRSLSPREMLGIFLALRARHYRDIGNVLAAEQDYLLSRYFYPTNRISCREQIAATAVANMGRFGRCEPGHPATFWILKSESEELATTYRARQTSNGRSS